VVIFVNRRNIINEIIKNGLNLDENRKVCSPNKLIGNFLYIFNKERRLKILKFNKEAY